MVSLSLVVVVVVVVVVVLEVHPARRYLRNPSHVLGL